MKVESYNRGDIPGMQSIVTIMIPYRPVVSELILSGTQFTTGFSTRKENVVVHVDAYIFFSNPNIVEPFTNVMSEVSDINVFDETFTNSFVNLKFLDIEGNVAGFHLIRNPIIFSPGGVHIG